MNFSSRKDANQLPEGEPFNPFSGEASENDIYSLSVHDLLSAFVQWVEDGAEDINRPVVQQAPSEAAGAAQGDERWPICNPWALAVDDARVAHGLDCTTEQDNAEESLSQLLQHAVDMALDPAISERANELLNTNVGAAGAAQPVAEVREPDELCSRIRWLKDYPPIGTKLYTSSTAAPEGWREAMEKAMELADAYSGTFARWFDDRADILRTLYIKDRTVLESFLIQVLSTPALNREVDALNDPHKVEREAHESSMGQFFHADGSARHEKGNES